MIPPEALVVTRSASCCFALLALLAPLAPLALLILSAEPALAQEYRFPTSSADYAEFYPTAYKDQGDQDWSCGGTYYAGHRGSDFGVGGFDGMAQGRDIVAAADGVVDATNDGVADDCTSGECPGGGGFGNYVKLVHADGKETWYAHLRTWSLEVSQGESVVCGQKLGEAGSSGFSTGPHLHFEVREAGDRKDPFAGPCSPDPGYWVEQGTHGGLPALTCDGSDPCTAVGELSCNQPVSSSNDAPGSTSSVLAYACTEYTYSGPEIAWSFTAAVTESVSVSLTGLSADLDLFVTDGEACAPSSCLAGSVSSGGADEALTFEAVAGSTYHVVVDGWSGATSALQLELGCTPPPGDDDDATADDDDVTGPGDDDSAPDDDDSADPDLDDDDGGPPDVDDPPFLPGEPREAGSGCRADLSGGFGWVLLLGLRRRRAARG